MRIFGTMLAKVAGGSVTGVGAGQKGGIFRLFANVRAAATDAGDKIEEKENNSYYMAAKKKTKG